MRRSEREIKDFDEIIDVLNRSETIRLGIFGGEYPYIVPLSFGYEIAEGKIVLYVHSAIEGKKYNLLAQDGRVCVEADFCHGFAQSKKGVTTLYESIIGFGRAEKIDGEEAGKGLNLLLAHCGYPGDQCSNASMQAVAVYKITLDSITGKRNLGR